jgi:hypothetical protein
VARKRAALAAQTRSFLRIELSEPLAGVEVYRDDERVLASDIGWPVPVDQGTHRVTVAAPHRQTWSQTLDIDGPATTVSVAAPALAASPDDVKARPAPSPKQPARPVRRRPAPAAAPPSHTAERAIALVVGGLGVAAVAGGVFEAVRYRQRNDDAKQLCPASVGCTNLEIAEHAAAVDDARTARTLAFIGTGGGAAALVTATILYLSSSAPDNERAHAKAAPRLALSPALGGRAWSAVLSGSF